MTRCQIGGNAMPEYPDRVLPFTYQGRTRRIAIPFLDNPLLDAIVLDYFFNLYARVIDAEIKLSFIIEDANLLRERTVNEHEGREDE